jgi:hypothetical protein
MLRTFRYFLILSALFLIGSFVPAVKGQRCSYNTKGVQEVPFDWATVTFGGGSVRILKGKVTGPNGAPMSDVTLALFKVVSDEEGGVFIGSTQTDGNGKYCFGSLPRGRYVLHVGTKGFQRTEIEFKMVSSSNTAGKGKLDVSLEVGY